VSITSGSIIRTAPRTAPRTKIRSVPKASVNRYLDLYVLTRKRTKLELELHALLKRKKSIEDDLKDLGKEIINIGKTVLKEDGKRNSKENAPKGAKEKFKTMVMDY